VSPAQGDGRESIPLRGPSGRLYGYLDARNLVIEVKRKGEPPEHIDIRPYLEAAKS
jgi:hypothetical protein